MVEGKQFSNRIFISVMIYLLIILIVVFLYFSFIWNKNHTEVNNIIYNLFYILLISSSLPLIVVGILLLKNKKRSKK